MRELQRKNLTLSVSLDDSLPEIMGMRRSLIVYCGIMKKRILLAKNAVATADVIRQELEFLAYRVTVAKNG